MSIWFCTNSTTSHELKTILCWLRVCCFRWFMANRINLQYKDFNVLFISTGLFTKTETRIPNLLFYVSKLITVEVCYKLICVFTNIFECIPHIARSIFSGRQLLKHKHEMLPYLIIYPMSWYTLCSNATEFNSRIIGLCSTAVRNLFPQQFVNGSICCNKYYSC